MQVTPRARFIFIAVSSYLLLALAWILLSDQLLGLLTSKEHLVELSTIKGIFFVLSTAALFFFCLRAVPSRLTSDREPLIDSLASTLLQSRPGYWLRYGFAILISLAMIGIRTLIPLPAIQSPMMILFMLPIILSALLGGVGPGLLATLMVATGIDLLASPSLHTIHTPGFLQLQWAMLMVNGIAVSLLSGLLRHALTRQDVQRQLLDAVVSGTPNAVFIKDLQGRYQLANAATAAFVGLPVEEILGKKDEAFFCAETTQAIHEKDAAVLASNQTATFEEVVCTEQGQKHIFLVTKGPLKNGEGKTIGLFGIAHDITERRRADADLHFVLHEAGDAIWIIDADGNFLYANPSACRLTGHNIDDLKQLHYEDLLPSEDRGQLPEHFSRLYEQKYVRHEWQLLRKDRQVITVELTTARLQDGRFMAFGRDRSEQKRAELALKEREQRLARVIEGSDQGYWEWDLRSNDFTVSARWEQMLGYEPGEMDVRFEKWGELVQPDDLANAMASIRRHMQGESPRHEVEIRCRAKNGEWRWILSKGRVVEWDKNGNPLIMSGTHTDITGRKLLEIAQQEAAVVFDSSYEGIMIVSPELRICKVNAAFTRITGYNELEAVGQYSNLLASGQQDPQFYKEMWQQVKERDFWRGELWNRRKNGELYAELLSISVVRDAQQQIQYYVGIFSDITQLKEHEAELDRVAHYDALTGVPNRRLLSDRLEQAILHAKRSGHSCAVCFLDLDGFKSINDRHGHEVGDQLLIGVTHRLKEVLRAEDTLARLGGDEFVLLLCNIANPDDCPLILDRIGEALANEIDCAGTPLTITASIGVSLYPEDNVDPDTLLRHADQAMYAAKAAGKNRYHFFDPVSDKKAQTHRKQLEMLRQALHREEFRLYYQPKVDLLDGTVIGVEALIRWQHPERGLLSPAEFLPFVQGSHIETDFGEWVLKRAMTQLQLWHEQGLNMHISVNISANHLLTPGFTEFLGEQLARYPHLPADRLELEVLESAAIADMEQACAIIAACRHQGVRFALDDFGTGYSSLTYLRKLPVDTLKIDQSFVRDMLVDPDDLGIVESVIQLATNFNRQVIAEGVETLEHGRVLRKLGCRLAQGYGIAKPMAAAQFPAWCQQWQEAQLWLTLNELNPG